MMLLLNIRFIDNIITNDISDNEYGSSKSSIVLVVSIVYDNWLQIIILFCEKLKNRTSLRKNSKTRNSKTRNSKTRNSKTRNSKTRNSKTRNSKTRNSKTRMYKF